MLNSHASNAIVLPLHYVIIIRVRFKFSLGIETLKDIIVNPKIGECIELHLPLARATQQPCTDIMR